MHINTDSLSAFISIQKHDSFTKAAHEQGISQSALSQKIFRLEDQLQVTLFIRGKSHITLTAAGEKLRLFAKQQLSFEQEFISQFDQDKIHLSGTIRLAGFSSIMCSMAIPSLAPFLRENTRASVEFSSHEVIDLEEVLKKNKADLVLTDYKPDFPGLESHLIGREEYIMIESNKIKKNESIYLDHGPHDNATDSFFKYQGINTPYERRFMGDVYSIIEAVKLGLGKAIMSKHLTTKQPGLKIKKFRRRYFREIYLSYYKQSYYSPLHKNICHEIIKESKKFL